MSFSHDYDFNFHKDSSDKLVSFVFGFLMYAMTVALISGVFTYNLTSEWKQALSGHLTIEFRRDIDHKEALTPQQKKSVDSVIQSFPGVKKARQLSEADVLKMLEQWLSGTAIPDDFPFPAIYDVEIDPQANPDLLLLSDQLAKIASAVKIHNHVTWYTPIMKISTGLFAFAALLSILVCSTVCATVVFITRKTLNIHRSIVHILQLIGASNRYIASQFKRYHFMISLKSSLLSIVLANSSIGAIIYVLGGNILSPVVLIYSGVSLIVPILITIIVMLTSHVTVLNFLKNDEWLEV